VTMIPLLFLHAALAAPVVLDAKVPVHVAVDGDLMAQLYQPARLYLEVSVGEHELSLTTHGTPVKYTLDVQEDKPLLVLVGRTGISIGEIHADEQAPEPEGPIPVDFRVVGDDRLVIQVAGGRHTVMPGTPLRLPLPAGEHPMVVRSMSGTSVYARGVLIVAPGKGHMVQLAEGMMPEVAGKGLSFHPGAR